MSLHVIFSSPLPTTNAAAGVTAAKERPAHAVVHTR
jgi:hypothetical protein